MKTTSTWITQQQFESRQDHNTIRLDGTKENGFSPKALLLSGLAACSGIDVVEILEKKRVPFSSLVIDAEAQLTHEHPKVFKHVLITYRIHTDLLNKEKVMHAIELSLEKYCGVSAMLKKTSPIDYKLVIEP
jgi:putative redox protein